MTPTRLILVAATALLAALPAAEAAKTKPAPPAKETAPTTKSLGKFEGWSAYASQDKVGRVCYLVGEAQQRGPAGKSAMAMVTHRPAEKISNVVSFVEGYPLKEGSDAVLDIGGTRFELFTKDDSAWARTAELDRTIVGALAKGRQAMVRSQPQKGPPTTEIYPLAGFPQALAAIDKACGIKRDGAASASSRRHKPRPKAVAH
jgi:hypothetical protein